MHNEYNTFQKMKGLIHKEHFDGIVNGAFLPPYCVCTDPSNICNQECIYCNAKVHRNRSRQLMPSGHLQTLAAFYKDWGVQSTIIEGGGEPLSNPETMDFIDRCYDYDIEAGLITNGSLIDNALIKNCDKLRFIGVSFDAAKAETYKAMRTADVFYTVCKNIELINRAKKTCDVNMKFLIHPLNYKEIYEFAKLAKELGCNGAHIKPVAGDNLVGVQPVSLEPYLPEIKVQIAQAKELEDESFTVHAVMYKFGDNLQRQVKFSSCECTPIGGVFGADGYFWLCYNMRGADGFLLGNHYPDPNNIKRLWGGKKHKELIAGIKTDNCMRCGLTAYNEIIENCIKQDKLFWKFL